jgi:hypothetical protein
MIRSVEDTADPKAGKLCQRLMRPASAATVSVLSQDTNHSALYLNVRSRNDDGIH